MRSPDTIRPPADHALIGRRSALRGGIVALVCASQAHRVVLAAASAKPGIDPLAEAELKRAERKGELCSASNATGTGLRGEYFAGAPDRGPAMLVRTDATVDFDRFMEWPADMSGKRPTVVRWTGWVKPPTSGRYRFHTGQPTARLWVSQKLMAGDGADADASMELAAGRFYPVKLLAERVDALDGRVRLEWTAPHGARFLVPRALLFLPNDSVPPVTPAAR